jgi:hypothetical protein
MIVAVCVVSMILKKPFQLERTGTLQHYERYERDEGPECLRVFPPIVPGTGQFVTHPSLSPTTTISWCWSS